MLLPPFGAVPSAPEHNAARLTTLKRVDRRLGVVALDVGARSQPEDGFPHLFHLQQEDAGPSDTVCLPGQGRGIKLVTEEPKPVSSGLAPFKPGATCFRTFIAPSPASSLFCLIWLSLLGESSRVDGGFDPFGSAIVSLEQSPSPAYGRPWVK